MAMFPDSGVPPADAKNSLPDVNTLNCDELWYSTSRCQPRFDPPAANAMLAELMNLIMKGEVVYDCVRLDHIERAVRYLIQRGLPRGTKFAGGPMVYTAKLDPTATRYNDFMTLTIIPNVNNQAAVLLNLDELGDRTILRNDGLPLQSADLKANKPELIAYWNGSWYVVGLVASQVPIIATGMLDTWIRTDGNDETGDGTANSADKAFRTINGALKKVGGRFAVSANFSIALRLGIPGTYEAGDLSGSPNRIYLIGDMANPGGYRIAGEGRANNSAACIWAYRSNELHIHGVTLQIDMPGRNSARSRGQHVRRVPRQRQLSDDGVEPASDLLDGCRRCRLHDGSDQHHRKRRRTACVLRQHC